MLVARVDSVCMQHGQSKQFAHLQQSTPIIKNETKVANYIVT